MSKALKITLISLAVLLPLALIAFLVLRKKKQKQDELERQQELDFADEEIEYPTDEVNGNIPNVQQAMEEPCGCVEKKKTLDSVFPIKEGSACKEVEQLQLFLKNQLQKQGIKVWYPDEEYGEIGPYTKSLMKKHLSTDAITKDQYDSLKLGGYKTFRYN